MKKIIFWFRKDLRISDNPGLFEAAQAGYVIPVYIFEDNNSSSDVILGNSSSWWLYRSLHNLNTSLENKLNLYKGNAKEILLKLISQENANAIYWNRRYLQSEIKIDIEITQALNSMNIEQKDFCSSLFWEPFDILKDNKEPYKVFTPFYKKGCSKEYPRKNYPVPNSLQLLKVQNNMVDIDSFNLVSNAILNKQLNSFWKVGEEFAQKRLINFLDEQLDGYKKNRDYPYKENTSLLSPHLHYGEISPYQIYNEIKDRMEDFSEEDTECFFKELCWREFSHYLLFHFPDFQNKNFQEKFDSFPWRYDNLLFEAWKHGKTGYPIVDAGMRQLLQTGYMHNRVRMITASFLVKNLLIDWRHGEKWFFNCLVDADIANNSAGWQWVSGSGADASPYFRIFNPITQGEKFDKDGLYTRHFIPELSNIPSKFLFKPWAAPADILTEAGVFLGKNYPMPIVNLENSRNEAMCAYRNMINVSMSRQCC